MNNYEKLISILREIFQIDQADLDFGIYRIMNQKRGEINDFLENKLIPQVKEEIAKANLGDASAVQKELDEAIAGAKALGVNPDDVPKVQNLKAQLATTQPVRLIEEEVFSHLAAFFKRYYDKGDFISLRRYKKDVYAIPYEGEEVKLYWANHDQYYIKSSEYLKNYQFKVGTGKGVRFELVEASTEQNNNKAQNGKERQFRIFKEKPLEVVDGVLVIYFTYLPSEQNAKREELNNAAFETIKRALPSDWMADVLQKVPTKTNGDRTLLEKHINDFTARNTFDYFIHKDLGGFLRRELDFYIKNEVLHIDDINTEDTKDFTRQLTKIKALKVIAHKVITFLEQLENFQKRLWLKKKFVVETNYCITVDKIPESYHQEIADNEAQWQEWEQLFAISELPKDLFNGGAGADRLTLLKEQEHLVLDTKFFSEDFKNRLLAEFNNLEKETDGLLINSENFQALELLQERYKEAVKCVYIDPPYNTEKDRNEGKFIYKDNFERSSWCAMMQDRIALLKNLISNTGTFFSSIDHHEIATLRTILNQVFHENNFEGLINWRRRHNQPNDKTKMIGLVSEYIISYAKDSFKYKADGVGKVGLTAKFSNPDNDPKGDWASKPWKVGSGQSGSKYTITTPTGKVLEEEWMGDYDTYKDYIDEGRIYFPDKGNGSPRKKYYKHERLEEGQCATNWWAHEQFGHNQLASSFLGDVFGEKNKFSNPKPNKLIENISNVANVKDDYVMDVFAGSGTTGNAIINLNRENGFKRKSIY